MNHDQHLCVIGNVISMKVKLNEKIYSYFLPLHNKTQWNFVWQQTTPNNEVIALFRWENHIKTRLQTIFKLFF